jgi:hypothetical protein
LRARLCLSFFVCFASIPACCFDASNQMSCTSYLPHHVRQKSVQCLFHIHLQLHSTFTFYSRSILTHALPTYISPPLPLAYPDANPNPIMYSARGHSPQWAGPLSRWV